MIGYYMYQQAVKGRRASSHLYQKVAVYDQRERLVFILTAHGFEAFGGPRWRQALLPHKLNGRALPFGISNAPRITILICEAFSDCTRARLTAGMLIDGHTLFLLSERKRRNWAQVRG